MQTKEKNLVSKKLREEGYFVIKNFLKKKRFR